jgi:hypothetical protein
MSYFIHVFCQSNKPVTRNEIANFIVEGYHFETTPLFEPPHDSSEIQAENWKTLVVHYRSDKRPIIFRRNVNDKLLREEIKEILDELTQAQLSKVVLQKFDAIHQVIAIEIDREGLTEDAWEMLDTVEGYIAQTLEGFVYAPDNGLYDKNLRPIYKFSND